MAPRFCKYLLVIFLCHHVESLEKIDNSLEKLEDENSRKSTTMYDYHTRMSAYKDLVGSGCYIEFIKNGEPSLSGRIRDYPSKKLPAELYISEAKLSKRRIWDLAGPRIWEFCRGFPTYLIQEVKNTDSNDVNPDDNDIMKSRLRRRRSTRHYFVGRLRGQTQSQYMNFGHSNSSNGKAEAESEYGVSRATVVGTNGMGQAQSQSSPLDCDECYRPIKTSEYEPVRTHGTNEWGTALESGGSMEPAEPGAITRPAYPGGTPPAQPGFPGKQGFGDVHPLPTPQSQPTQPIGYPIGPKQPTGTSQTGFAVQPTQPGYPVPSVKPGPTQIEYLPTPAQPRYPAGPTQPGFGQNGGQFVPVQPGYPTGQQTYPSVPSQPDLSNEGRPSVSFDRSKQPRYPQGSSQSVQGGSSQPGYPTVLSPSGYVVPRQPGSSIGSLQPMTPTGPSQPGFQYQQPGYPSGSTQPAYSRQPSQTGIPTQPAQQTRPQETAGLGGRFGGNLGGNYGTNVGHRGRFSGQFSGTFEGNGASQSRGQVGSTNTGYPFGTIQPGHVERPTNPEYTEGITSGYPTETGKTEYPTGHFPTFVDKTVPSSDLGGSVNQVTGHTPESNRPGQYAPVQPVYDGGSSTASKPGYSVMPSQHVYQEIPGQPGIPVDSVQSSWPGPRYSVPTQPDYQGKPPQAGTQNIPIQSNQHVLPQKPITGTVGRFGGDYQNNLGNSGTFSGQFSGSFDANGRPVKQGPGDLVYPGPGTTPVNYRPPTTSGQYQPGSGVGNQPGRYQPGSVSGHQSGASPGQFQPNSFPGHYQSGAEIGQKRPDSLQEQYQPGSSPGQYRPGSVQDQYPSGLLPGQYQPGEYQPGSVTGNYKPVRHQPDSVSGQYEPGSVPGQYTPGSDSGQYTPGSVPGQYKPGSVPGQYTPGSVPGQYTPGSVPGQYTPGSVPGKYTPGSVPGQYTPGSVPGQYTPGAVPGQYKPGSVPGQYTPGSVTGQYTPGSVLGQHEPGSPQNQPGSPQYQPGSPPNQPGLATGQYQPNLTPGQYTPNATPGRNEYGTGVNTNQQGGSDTKAPSNLEQPSGISHENGDSQVQASVQQGTNQTQASAQAQGKLDGGTSQSQVTGTYSGTGSFSASAGSDDGKRGALTQISGGKQGATSAAQGRGGEGQSQAQMQLFSDTGRILSSAQSGGKSFTSQTQVQGGEEGGMANAQSNGSGQTSSQAQIGFSPYKKDDPIDSNQKNYFLGGGTANAQGSSVFGQSQSQIQGKFKYGIKYSGGAQAQTGNRDKNSTHLSFDPQFQIKPIIPLLPSDDLPIDSTLSATDAKKEASTDDSNQNKETITITEQQDTLKPTNQSTPTSDNDDEEYDYEDNETEKPSNDQVITQTRNGQTQHIVLPNMRNLDANVIQRNFDDFEEKVYQPENNLPLQHGDTFEANQEIPGISGYRIPPGFRGKVKAVASPSQTYAIGKNSQAQSVTITPGTGRITYQKSNRKKAINYKTYNSYQPYQYFFRSGETVVPNFVSVSKSETGYENPKTGRRVSSTHYTQSSTCGLITNTCVIRNNQRVCLPNIVRSADGSVRIC